MIQELRPGGVMCSDTHGQVIWDVSSSGSAPQPEYWSSHFSYHHHLWRLLLASRASREQLIMLTPIPTKPRLRAIYSCLASLQEVCHMLPVQYYVHLSLLHQIGEFWTSIMLNTIYIYGLLITRVICLHPICLNFPFSFILTHFIQNSCFGQGPGGAFIPPRAHSTLGAFHPSCSRPSHISYNTVYICLLATNHCLDGIQDTFDPTGTDFFPSIRPGFLLEKLPSWI